MTTAEVIFGFEDGASAVMAEAMGLGRASAMLVRCSECALCGGTASGDPWCACWRRRVPPGGFCHMARERNRGPRIGAAPGTRERRDA